MSYSISPEPCGGSLGPATSPGLRTLVVPRMAARGIALDEIASVTHVPMALVELIVEHTTLDPRLRGEARTQSGQAAGAKPVRGHSRLRLGKGLVRMTTFIFLAAATLASVLLHAPFLPLAVLVAGGWLGRRP
ncbi:MULTISPECIES: hypothetical protein [Arthrobacter]|uniref:Uncharacterized protein n=1 Tax=Arthrobacter terricola TaxID=2547396 RepID=A0A4R5K6V7_9MICC|nr:MULTISPECIES: hypothetical protein [Arthrobacter]MBT8161722.1 hypothetical protein [Arthrobacter sp. GN70]TDF89406.1 hypothetical protein E1809_23090 [Arthrobacter terricola]